MNNEYESLIRAPLTVRVDDLLTMSSTQSLCVVVHHSRSGKLV